MRLCFHKEIKSRVMFCCRRARPEGPRPRALLAARDHPAARGVRRAQRARAAPELALERPLVRVRRLQQTVLDPLRSPRPPRRDPPAAQFGAPL